MKYPYWLIVPLLGVAVLAGCGRPAPEMVITQQSPECTQLVPGQWLSVFENGREFLSVRYASAEVCTEGITFINPAESGENAYPGPVLILTRSGKQQSVPLSGNIRYEITPEEPLN